MMMVASLVVRSGCGTPLWLRGEKGGGVEIVGVVVFGGVGVIDIDINVVNWGRGSPYMVIRLAALTINEQDWINRVEQDNAADQRNRGEE